MVFLTVWAVVAALMLLETYFRFFYIKSDAFGMLGTNFSKKYYKNDKWHFRDSGLPLSELKPNIIILGDSFAYGHGLKSPEDRYSNILREELGQYHIINMSKNGASTENEIGYLLKNHCPGTDTALVVLNYVFNDIEDSIPLEQRYRKKTPDKTVGMLLKFSELFTQVYYRFIYPLDEVNRNYINMLTSAYDDTEILQEHVHKIRILDFIVKDLYQAKLVIVVWPYLRSIRYTPQYSRILNAFKELKIPYIDLVENFKPYNSRELMLSTQDPHPSKLANKVVSTIVNDYIMKELWTVEKRPSAALYLPFDIATYEQARLIPNNFICLASERF